MPVSGKSTSPLAEGWQCGGEEMHVRGFRILVGVSTTEFICSSGCANFRTAMQERSVYNNVIYRVQPMCVCCDVYTAYAFKQTHNVCAYYIAGLW